MEAQADPPGGEDLRLEQVAPPGGKHVVVIGGGAAAGQGQPTQVRGGGGVHEVGVQPGPDRVQRGQPAEQRVVGRVSPGDPLVQMVMGIDQAGGGQQPGAVDSLRVGVPGRQRTRPDRRDPVVLHDQIAGRVFRPGLVHRRDMAAFNCQHARSLLQIVGTPVWPAVITAAFPGRHRPPQRLISGPRRHRRLPQSRRIPSVTRNPAPTAPCRPACPGRSTTSRLPLFRIIVCHQLPYRGGHDTQ